MCVQLFYKSMFPLILTTSNGLLIDYTVEVFKGFKISAPQIGLLLPYVLPQAP